MRQGRGGAAATAAVVGVVGLVLLLVGWAATSGPTRVLHGGRAAQTREPRVTPTSSPAAGGPPGGGERFVPQDHPWLTVLFVLVEGAAVLLLAVLLYRLLRVLVTRVPAFRRRGPGGRRSRSSRSSTSPPSWPGRSRAARRPSAASCSAAGTPRNAIVACWHRFEEQAAGVGVVRQPVGDLLGVHPADPRRGRRRHRRGVPAGRRSTGRRGSPSTSSASRPGRTRSPRWTRSTRALLTRAAGSDGRPLDPSAVVAGRVRWRWSWSRCGPDRRPSPTCCGCVLVVALGVAVVWLVVDTLRGRRPRLGGVGPRDRWPSGGRGPGLTTYLRVVEDHLSCPGPRPRAAGPAGGAGRRSGCDTATASTLADPAPPTLLGADLVDGPDRTGPPPAAGPRSTRYVRRIEEL